MQAIPRQLLNHVSIEIKTLRYLRVFIGEAGIEHRGIIGVDRDEESSLDHAR